MPQVAVPAVGKVAAKWARRVQGATEDYTAGVAGAGGRWAPAAKAGEQNYRTGVTAAAGAGRYGRGIDRVGDGKWHKNAQTKGSQRYGPGAQAAEGDFGTAIGPVLEVIGRTDLPARGPKGADANYNRSSAVGKALRQFREGRAR
ncbi:MAG TPA: hypothetical protein VGT02_13195 [Methylomirabilota bacterium]|jgi:hypothetical protein|nr:hypothetical protein [Methylomirabilota bacterium]